MMKYYIDTPYGKILTPIEQQHWEEPEDGEETFSEGAAFCKLEESFMVGENTVREMVYNVFYINGVVIIRWINGELQDVKAVEDLYDY